MISQLLHIWAAVVATGSAWINPTQHGFCIEHVPGAAVVFPHHAHFQREGCFFPLMFEMVVQSSHVPELQLFPSQWRLSKVQLHCRRLQEEETKHDVGPWGFDGVIDEQLSTSCLEQRAVGRSVGLPFKVGDQKHGFSCTVVSDEMNEAESVGVSFPFETQISAAAALISPQCLEGKGNAGRWSSWLMESSGCQKEHLDSRQITCNIIHPTPCFPGQTLAVLLNDLIHLGSFASFLQQRPSN